MVLLNIASKANQATTLSALLVASYANESDPNTAIAIKFDEVNTLESGGGASVELILGDNAPIYGPEKVIESLLTTYPSLQEQHQDIVG